MSKKDLEIEKKKEQLRRDMLEFEKAERNDEIQESIEIIGNNLLSALASITSVSASALETLVENTKEENRAKTESEAALVKRRLELRKKQVELKEIEKLEKMQKKRINRWPNRIGWLVFFLSFTIPNMHLIPAVLLGFGARFLSKKVYYERKYKPIELTEKAPALKKPEDVNRFVEVMKEANKDLDQIYTCAEKANDNEIKDLSIKLYERGLAILDHIKKYPKKISKSSRFLSYYLDTAAKICQKYCEFSSQNIKSQDIDGVLESTKRAMILLEKAFDNEFLKLVEDDIIDIETDVKVLENSMKWDNYMD